jgi:peptidyl-prolyl cis-trans isomerase D
MLRALREGTKKGFFIKFFMFGFLLMGLGGLVFMDIGGFFRGGLGSTTVARIGDKEISIYKFQNDAQRVIRQQNLTMEEAHQVGYTSMILNAMVSMELLNQAADDLDIEISKAKTEETIGRMLDTYDVDNMNRKQKLESLLTNQNLNEQTLISQTETQLKTALLKNALTSVSMLIPDATAEAFKTYQNEYRNVKAFVLTSDMIDYNDVPSEGDIESHYEMTLNNYKLPEKRNVSAIMITPDLFEDDIIIEEDDIKAVYEERKDMYQLPERRYLKQAVVSDAATAQKILELAKSGTDLKAATKRITGDEKAFREETFFDKDGLLESLAEPVFSQESPTLLPETYESALGYHVVEMTKIEEPRQQEYEEVKDAIKSELTQQQTDDSLQDMLDRADELLMNGDSIEQIATGLGVELLTFENLTQNPDDFNQAFMMYGVYETESLSAAIFELDENIVSDLIDLDNDGFLMAATTSITAETTKPLEDVRDEVVSDWKALKESQAMLGNAAEIANKINSDQESTLESEAKARNAKILSFENLTRNSDVPEGMTSDLFTAIFDTAKLNRATYSKNSEDGSFYIFKVEEIGYPEDIMEDEEPLAVQKLQIVRPLENTVQELFHSHLYASSDVQINKDLLDYAFGGRANN